MAKLTVKELESLTEANMGETVRDDGGLRGKVRRNNRSKNGVSVTFVLRYKWEGKTKDFPCGTWPGESLADIRKTRDAAKIKIQEGLDPGLERKATSLQNKIERAQAVAKLEERMARDSTNALFGYWSAIELSKRRDGGKETLRGFRKDVLPVIGHLRAEDISKADVMKIIDAVLARGSNRMAKRFLSELRQMFGFGLDREIIHTDPTARIKKDRIGGRDVIRTRHLSESEIRELKAKMPDANFAHTTVCALWIMLSTCCRVGEISRARWQDLNLDERTWKIPKEHAKNGRELVVYLSDFTKEQFQCLEIIKTHDVWMFPARTGTSHVSTKSISKQVADRQRITAMKNRTQATATLLLSGGHWTPHDLRRTGATIMGNLRVQPDVIEKCLNHTEESKLKRTYQQQAMVEEQREAWRLLGDRLSLVLNDDGNVMLMRYA
jgi:integrase